MSKMARWAKREAGDPIRTPDDRVRFEMKQVDIFAKGRGADRASFSHDQSIRQDPGEADPGGRMNLVTKLFLEKRAPQLPRQKKTQRHQDRFHNCAPRLR